jgi:D-amino peptidase
LGRNPAVQGRLCSFSRANDRRGGGRLRSDLSRALVALPQRFVLELAYRDHAKAYTFGFYPGARRVDDLTVQLETENYLDVLRALMFAM